MDTDVKNTAEPGGIRIPERVIPLPKSVSPSARAMLAMPRPPRGSYPPLSDKAAWKAQIDQMNVAMIPMLQQWTAGMSAQVERTTIAGVTVYVAEPKDVPERNRDKALLYFHGGGLVLLGGDAVSHMAVMEAVPTRCKTFAVDYRNPPDHPYPAALDDCIAVYRELLKTYAPKQLVISGNSGGGNLAAAVPLKARDLGLPLPAALGLFTPEVDLTESGDSFQTNRDVDVVLPRGLPEMNALYADGHDLSDPYVSPLFGDFTKGFAPTFIQTGTRDLFLSNSVRMHAALQRAGIKAELYVGEAMPHGGFGGHTAEDAEMRAAFARFLAEHAGWAGP